MLGLLRHAVLIRDHVCTVIKFSLSDFVSSVSPQGHGFGVQEMVWTSGPQSFSCSHFYTSGCFNCHC